MNNIDKQKERAIYDKLKDIGYAAKIYPIEYDENDEPINL